MHKRTLICIGLLCVALLTVLSSFWFANVDWSKEHFLQLGNVTILQFGVLAISMFGYWYFGPKSNNWKDYKTLLIVAIIVRIAVIPLSPYTSNDVDRYLFDGKIALSGFDPYRTSHDNPALAKLRQEWPTPNEHAKYPTLYPPGAIALYAVSATSGPEYAELTWKFLSSLAGILLLLVMVCLLIKMNKLKHISLIALSPLLIIETGIGAHVDIFSALAIASALLFWYQDKLKSVGIALGIGALIKLVPILLLVPLCFYQPNLKRFFSIGLSALLVLCVGYGIAFSLSMHPIGSTPIFFEKWRNASPLFDVLNNFVQGKDLFYLIISIILLALIAIAFFAWRNRNNNKTTLIKYMQLAIVLPLLLSPVIFPWYLVPLVPLFALRPTAFLTCWFLILPITYEVLNQFACCNQWAPQQWPTYLLALGLSLGFLVDCFVFRDKFRKLETYA